MYDPTVGRWTTEDPIKFRAGDPNLERYVGNDPTNAVDPSGLVGVFFDGFAYDLSDKTIIATIYNAYQGTKYYYTPRAGDNSKEMEDAYRRIKNAIAKNPDEPVDLFGWSRGSYQAIALANKLASDGIKVRFLGLLDPSIPAKVLEGEDYLHFPMKT